jgi:hypothetical protein
MTAPAWPTASCGAPRTRSPISATLRRPHSAAGGRPPIGRVRSRRGRGHRVRLPARRTHGPGLPRARPAPARNAPASSSARGTRRPGSSSATRPARPSLRRRGGHCPAGRAGSAAQLSPLGAACPAVETGGPVGLASAPLAVSGSIVSASWPPLTGPCRGFDRPRAPNGGCLASPHASPPSCLRRSPGIGLHPRGSIRARGSLREMGGTPAPVQHRPVLRLFPDGEARPARRAGARS